MNVSSGKLISVEYKLKLDGGEEVDSNVEKKPLTFVQGENEVISGLEKSVEGMQIGERKQFTISAEEGFGPINKNAFFEVEKERVPQDSLKLGAKVEAQDKNGQAFKGRVSEIKKEKVVVDFNHPLAGKTLHFEVKVLDVQEVV